jgi:hypothetical protein
MVLKYDLSSSDVGVVDTTPQELTSHEKLRELFRGGHQLEAAATQCLLVEAMLLQYLLGRNQADQVQYLTDPRELLRNKRLTFGRAHRLLVEVNGYHDPTLAQRVGEYVELRNELAHHLIARARRLDLGAFFDLGGQLVDLFRAHAHELIRRHEGKTTGES